MVTPECPARRACRFRALDAHRLFDGKDLSAWQQANGKPIAWKLGDGYFEDLPGSGNIVTQAGFGIVSCM